MFRSILIEDRMSSPATSATPARASRWWRGLGEARAHCSCLKLEEEEQVGEDLGGKFLAPRKKMK